MFFLNGEQIKPTLCIMHCFASIGARKRTRRNMATVAHFRGDCSGRGMYGHKANLRKADKRETCGSAESGFAADPLFFRGFNLLSCEWLILVCPSLHCLYKPPEMGIYGEYVCVVAGLNYQIHPNPRKACASYGHNPGCSWTTTRTASLLQTEDLGLFPPFRTGYGAQITTTM